MRRRTIEGTAALLAMAVVGCGNLGAPEATGFAGGSREAGYEGVLPTGAVADASTCLDGAPPPPVPAIEPPDAAVVEAPDHVEQPRPDLAPAPPAIVENEFKAAQGEDQRSTFAVDVDTASYALVRRFLQHGQVPPAGMVRIEELINTFELADPPPPTDGAPFAARVEVAGCPWQGHRLVRVSLRGREVTPAQRPVSNLVFLVDVSGSMSARQRLPLLKHGLRRLVEQLGEKDRVAIVVYAGAAGLVLPPTSGGDKGKLLAAINALEAGGSTNGGAGIQLAYRTALEGFVDGGVNRVLLCTDGDFNVGASSAADLERLIEEKRSTGVFLTCLGFGVWRGDQRMETLADRGNGHYALIEDERDAQRVLVDELSGTLMTIARDVKVQVEWNPALVRRYRLIGYENRVMANRDFADDHEDGGELGAGHRVTALYEVEPMDVDRAPSPAQPLLTLRLRWQEPEVVGVHESQLLELAGYDRGTSFADATPDLKFVASVAAGGMLLRGSPHAGDATWARAIRWASEGRGPDPAGLRAEWLDLLRRAAHLHRAPAVEETSSAGHTPGADRRG